jgi:hypothetical protein
MPLHSVALALLLTSPSAAGGEHGCAPRFRDGEHIGCACVLDNVDYARCREGDEESCATIEHCLERRLEPSPIVAPTVRGDIQEVLMQILPMWSAERMRAAETALLIAIEGQHAGMALALIDAGAPPGATTKHGHTALELARRSGPGRIRIIEALLEAGAAPDRGKVPPLVGAAYAQDREVVALLLAAGADPNVTSGHEHNTALVGAALRGNAQLVQALLDAGADPRHRNRSGRTAAAIANEHGHEQAAALLEAAEAAAAR